MSTELAPLLAELRARCAKIDVHWRAAKRDYMIFPSIVREHTDDLDLTPFGQIQDLVRLLESKETADLQQLSSFSDLYLKLYDNGHFWVEVLNWWASDINIHDHDFTGVQFQLNGSSLNVGYGFVQRGKIDGIKLGALSINGAALWKPGDRSIVEPGRVAPHNVCHIDVPTVSLLIRTHPKASYGPQWNYFPPGIAGSYGVATVTFRKRVQALRLLAKGDPATFREAFEYFCSRATRIELLFALVKMIDIVFEREYVDVLHKLADISALHEAIVESVIFYRALETIKYLKNSTRLAWRQQLALSIMASGASSDQFVQIIRFLRGGGFEPGFDNPIAELMGASPQSVTSRLETMLPIFDTAA